MKIVSALFVSLLVVPVSLASMIWGWGLEPKNPGWIAFGYLWMVAVSVLGAANQD